MAKPPEILSDTPVLQAGTQRMDVLSDVLRVVRLSGAALFRCEFHEPWCVASDSAAKLAQLMGLVSRCVVVFHEIGRAHV